jgi:hypothetical protein
VQIQAISIDDDLLQLTFISMSASQATDVRRSTRPAKQSEQCFASCDGVLTVCL